MKLMAGGRWLVADGRWQMVKAIGYRANGSERAICYRVSKANELYAIEAVRPSY
ncbi:MAG: hypothetical protein QMD08_02835 [Actinomycetota bacterium]|nr:hypothetical protein [Actinomycetota bacterium]